VIGTFELNYLSIVTNIAILFIFLLLKYKIIIDLLKFNKKIVQRHCINFLIRGRPDDGPI
jgi:hypothetical protein